MVDRSRASIPAAVPPLAVILAVVAISACFCVALILAYLTGRAAGRDNVKTTAVRDYLARLARRLGHPQYPIQANIMLVTKGGKRLRVDQRTAFNAKQAGASVAFELPRGSGVPGVSERYRKGIMADLRILKKLDTDLFLPEERHAMSGSATILSVPLFDPTHPGDLLGVLNVESSEPLDVLKWDDKAVALAENAASAISAALRD